MTLSTGTSGRSDTIVAIATPPGTGAIGIIRVSGPAAVAVVSRVARLAQPRSLLDATPRTLHRADVTDPERDETLDVALVAKMPGPRSYTGEDVVELSCHGNPLLLAEIVRLLLEDPRARLAEPGEFTKRAYLNGRLDLLQAEAVAALISARTERAVRLVARQLSGPLSEEIGGIRESLLELIAGLEVTLDFPDEGMGITQSAAVKQAEELANRLRHLLARAERGRAIHGGLVMMIAGAPNVGKSSLLNALVGTERAIVSPSPGTTRDLVEDTLVIGGVAVRVVDGAGLGTPGDPVEAEGMRRARQALLESDLVVVVLDRSRPTCSDDLAILRLTAERPRVLVANKGDLPPACGGPNTCELVCSALTGDGMGALRVWLERWVFERTREDIEEGGVVASLRALAGIDAGRVALEEAARALAAEPIEAVIVDLREAARALGQTLGVDRDEAILERIFSSFCVGK